MKRRATKARAVLTCFPTAHATHRGKHGLGHVAARQGPGHLARRRAGSEKLSASVLPCRPPATPSCTIAGLFPHRLARRAALTSISTNFTAGSFEREAIQAGSTRASGRILADSIFLPPRWIASQSCLPRQVRNVVMQACVFASGCPRRLTRPGLAEQHVA
jgi:hypothetical protein